MRFFPLATTGTEEGYKLEEHIQVAVAHMIHLEHLIWTVSPQNVARSYQD